MTSSLRPHKDYHDEEFDPIALVQIYGGEDKTETKEELLEFPMTVFFQLLSSGSVKGNTLIDLSLGFSFCHLFIVANYFKEIILIESSDSSIKEIKKWLQNESTAMNWCHVSTFSSKLHGESEAWMEHEDKLRNAITHVLKYDFSKPKPLGPIVLPQADCLTSVWYLEAASRDHGAYVSNLKNISSHLKVGGHIILFVFLNISYFTINHHKFSMLTCDEAFILRALDESGYILESSAINESKLNTHLIDHEHVAYFVARKEKVV